MACPDSTIDCVSVFQNVLQLLWFVLVLVFQVYLIEEGAVVVVGIGVRLLPFFTDVGHHVFAEVRPKERRRLSEVLRAGLLLVDVVDRVRQVILLRDAPPQPVAGEATETVALDVRHPDSGAPLRSLLPFFGVPVNALTRDVFVEKAGFALES